MNAKDEKGGKTPRFSSWRSWRLGVLGVDLFGGREGQCVKGPAMGDSLWSFWIKVFCSFFSKKECLP
jgi:hypothetical protein